MVPLFAKLKSFPKTFVCHNITLESRIIGGVGIIGGREGGGGVVDIEIIINNRGGGVGRGCKNSAGGFLVLIC